MPSLQRDLLLLFPQSLQPPQHLHPPLALQPPDHLHPARPQRQPVHQHRPRQRDPWKMLKTSFLSRKEEVNIILFVSLFFQTNLNFRATSKDHSSAQQHTSGASKEKR